jgi:hypothetical protein
MVAALDRLTLLPFPQRWANGTLDLRIVVLPRGNPLLPLMTGTPGVADGPAFADADLKVRATLVSGLDALPAPGPATAEVPLTLTAQPGRRALYEEIASQFDIDPALEAATLEPRRAGRRIKKYLPESYRDAFPFGAARTPFAVTDDEYWCAIRDGGKLTTPPVPLSKKTVWGRLIAQALRQPLLARRLSILDIQTVTPPAGVFATGGWLYLTLETGAPYADHVATKPELLKTYAARIPVLGAGERPLFAPVLFPVATIPPTGDMDEIQAEAAGYDDGFAHIVHSTQKTTSDPTGMNLGTNGSPIVDTGVQLGWDDEQVLIWQNRQIDDPTVEQRNAPMGVMGYRVDAREAGTAAWSSLVGAEADLAVGPIDLGNFTGDLTVEVAPLQLDNEENGDYWMPAFFTEWRGRSLVTADAVALQVSGESAAGAADSYTPIAPDAVTLRYGKTYDFRVRLADISGGGPPASAEPVDPATAPITTCRFRRLVPPREVSVPGVPDPIDPANPPASLSVVRPRLHHPAAVFAGIANAEQKLLAEVAAIQAAAAGGGPRGEPGLPDPDVATLRIELFVVGLEFDGGNATNEPPRRLVYQTQRTFPANVANPLTLPLDYVDGDDVAALVPPVNGALPIPTGRDVILVLTPIGKEDVNLDYFGSQEARVGRSFEIQLRRAPFDETDLFVPDTDAGRLRSILLRPDESVTGTLVAKLFSSGRGVESEHEPLHRLAAELVLQAESAQLSSNAAERVVFGCSAAIAHILAPDRSVITFASKADLVGRWINVVTVAIDRDWTWRNADRAGFEISRDGEVVGTIGLPNALNPRVWETAEAAGREPERTFTRLVFFDAVDPKPTPPGFPAETSHTYRVTPRFRDVPGAQDPPLDLAIDLPIAAPPTQTPKLVSAGIALSPYVRATDYSSTEPRDRMLWLELTEEIENPADAYFVRFLSYAPDPMLTRGETVDVPPEPPLPIDPESIRVIRPGQSDDRAGLGAMELLIPTDSPRHFLVPLPPGLTRDSRELFGFFVVELRVGHHDGWSTAQARFGPALRVAGVQHPAPTLYCQAMRTSEQILAAATHATPVFNGRNLLPPFPATELWFLLYAQVIQADGKDHRNILLARRRGRPTERRIRSRVETDLTASTGWTQAEVDAVLEAYELPVDSPLSVLAIELLPEVERPEDPLGADLGEVRILRASPLVKLDEVCEPSPTA